MELKSLKALSKYIAAQAESKRANSDIGIEFAICELIYILFADLESSSLIVVCK